MITITSLYGLTPPSKKEKLARERKVAEVIKSMGDKYLLSKPVNRNSVANKEFFYAGTTTY